MPEITQTMSTNTMINLDIVIPVYNAKDCVERLIDSLKNLIDGESNTINTNVYIVDDASNEETKCYLRSIVSDNIFLIENDINKGYTVTLNKGMRSGVGKYVLQLNSDVEVASNSIKKMLNYMESHPQLFAISPLSNAASWQSIPDLFDPSGGMAVNDLLPGLTIEEMDAFCEIYGSGLALTQLLNGFCVLYRREVLEILNFADELRFPRGYGEEDDLHLRAANLGYQLAICTDCYVYHRKTQSFTSDQKKILSHQGRIKLNKSFGSSRIKEVVESLKVHPKINRIRIASQAFNFNHTEAMKQYLSIDWSNSTRCRDEELLSIIMPVYKGAELTKKTIETLLISLDERLNYELIVVLNGCDFETKDVVNKLRLKYKFKVVNLNTNLNFSMGCNIGYINSKGSKLIFVNNDMVFDKNEWAVSISKALDLEGIGCASVKLCYEDSTVQSAGFVWSERSFFPLEIYKNLKSSELSSYAILDGVTGACLGIKSFNFAKVKGFDPIFINGSEDIDLCLKLRVNLNLKSYVDYDANVVHLESKSPNRAVHILPNRRYFYQIWNGAISKIARDFGNRVVQSDHLPKPISMYKFR